MQKGGIGRPTGDQVAGAVIVAFFFLYGWKATTMRRSLAADVIGPDTFPLLVAGLGVLLGTLLAIRSSLRRLEEGPLRIDPALVSTLIPWLMVLAYAVGVYVIGFEIASAIFLIASVRWFSRVRLLSAAIYAVVFVGIIHVTFVVMLGMVLPEGTLFRLF